MLSLLGLQISNYHSKTCSFFDTIIVGVDKYTIGSFFIKRAAEVSAFFEANKINIRIVDDKLVLISLDETTCFARIVELVLLFKRINKSSASLDFEAIERNYLSYILPFEEGLLRKGDFLN